MARDLNLYTVDQTKRPNAYTQLKWQAINTYLAWMKGPFGQRWVANDDLVVVQRPAYDLNNHGTVDVGDFVVVGKFYQKRWLWYPY